MAPRRRQERPEDTNIRGVTGAGEEEARQRWSGDHDWSHDPPWDRTVSSLRSRPAGGGVQEMVEQGRNQEGRTYRG